MFCDQCGAELQAAQSFCSRCGKRITGVALLGYPRPNRVNDHIRILGILWLALSALDGLQGVAAYLVASVIFNPLTHPERPAFLHPLLSAFGLFLVLKAFAGFAVGWGLINREPWARTVVLALAIVSLFFNIPFGIALGVYTLWVLLPVESERQYEAQSRTKLAA
jgi:phage shock protein PspC (stress-responsive transcriptional regulator)